MNIKALRESFMILTLPLLVYGQVSINPSGSVTDGESYTLACTITSFTGTATWTKDGSSLTICTATFCTVPDIDDYKFSSNASGIQVVMYPVSSSIDGLWECAASGNIQQINVTSTRSPGNNEKEAFPIWAIIIPIVVILALGCLIVILLIRKKGKEKTESLQLIFVRKDLDKEFGPNYTDEDATVDVSWEKNGKEVIPLNSDRMKINITRATSEDEGLYVCTLKSKNMQFKYSIIVFGTVEIVYVQMGSKKVFGRTIHDEITTAKATWTKNGKKVKSTHSERTKFKIVKATSEDEGSYVCTFGENNMQLTFSLVVVGTLVQVYVQKELKIKFGKSISDANTIANAVWTKNDAPVDSTYSGRTQFKIKKASEADEGLYVCTFGSKKMQLKYFLNVVDEVMYVQNGDGIDLGKDIEDENISHSQWTHNGKTVTSQETSMTKIKIKNALKSDAGLYVCTFGPNTMRLKYQLIVDGSKSKKTKSNVPVGRLTPVDNTAYKGRSPLDHKPFGDPLPPLTSLPPNQTKIDK